MVVLYSTHCPKCRVLELKLQQHKIPYDIVDDIEMVKDVGGSHNITSAPFIEKDSIFYNFTDAIKMLSEVKENEH